MNISLTEDLKAFVDGRIKARGYSSASEYVRDLVRRDEERAVQERFKALIQDGLDSGPDARTWDTLRDGWTSRIEAARGAKPPQSL